MTYFTPLSNTGKKFDLPNLILPGGLKFQLPSLIERDGRFGVTPVGISDTLSVQHPEQSEQ